MFDWNRVLIFSANEELLEAFVVATEGDGVMETASSDNLGDVYAVVELAVVMIVGSRIGFCCRSF